MKSNAQAAHKTTCFEQCLFISPRTDLCSGSAELTKGKACNAKPGLGIFPHLSIKYHHIPHREGQDKLKPRTSIIQEMTRWEKDPESSLLPSCLTTVNNPPPAVMVSCFPAALTPLSHSSPGHLYQVFIWQRRLEDQLLHKKHGPEVLLTTCFLEILRSNEKAMKQ